MISSFSPSPVNAGNISTKPDPELLKRFEAERDAARAAKLQAQEKIRRADEEIQRGKEIQRRAAEKADAELCRLGVLPASRCP